MAANVTPTVCRPALTEIHSEFAPAWTAVPRDSSRIPVEPVHQLAVHRDLELLAGDFAEGAAAAHVALVDREHLEDVVRVGRELVLDEHAAAGAERQPLDVIVLADVLAAQCTRPAWPRWPCRSPAD